jgi:hypothetical protein
MKTNKMINQLLAFEDEYNELEKKYERLLNQSSPEQVTMSRMETHLVELGKRNLFDSVLEKYGYRTSMSYDKDGADKTFEEWYKEAFKENKVPSFISVEEAKEYLLPMFQEKYKELCKEAQLEYARSCKGEE